MRGAKLASALVSSNRAEVLRSVVLAGVLGTAFGVPTARAGDTCQPHWRALEAPGGVGVNNRVTTMSVYDDGTGPALYAGGEFWFAGCCDGGGLTVNRIARWNGSGWSTLSGPNGVGITSLGSVWSTAVFDDGSGPALYAGGTYSAAGGVTVNNIARWNGSAWSALSGPSGTGVNGWVFSLAEFDDGSGPALYAAGGFTTAGGVTVNRIAKWDGSAWSALVHAGGVGHGSQCNALAVFDDGSGPALYIGNTNGLVRWDGSSMSTPAGPNGLGVGGWVLALEVFDDGSGPALYASGNFANAGGMTVNNIARWDGSVWSALSGPGGVGIDGPLVTALGSFDDGSGPALYAGGAFSTAGGVTVNNIARWDGSVWSALASPGSVGVSDQIHALTVFDDGTRDGPALFAGGYHWQIGDTTVFNISKWQGCAVTPPPCLADINGDGTLDFFDVQLFLSLYAAGNLATDFTGDGTLDFFDVQAFLNLYAAGCP
ncbi:MAG: hypothetical protein KF757_08160 [Phycisphaeraceae bacterium]|nr:hypothetical protein [Phycisphaeraceae bacterium]MCW5762729.1 hypothetical protein [Phycisphaeraceae bacterium]